MQKVRGKDISMIFQDPASALNPIVKIKKQLLEAIFIHMKMTKKEALEKCRKMIVPLCVVVYNFNFYNFTISLNLFCSPKDLKFSIFSICETYLTSVICKHFLHSLQVLFS